MNSPTACNAQAKRGGVTPAQIVGEPEQARSRGHDQGAYGCVRPTRRLNDARDLLAPVHGWFTEGFDMLDLSRCNSAKNSAAVRIKAPAVHRPGPN
jgi:hypothetical protein